MPRSQFVSAARLKPLVAYCAVAFLVVLGLGTIVPPGTGRTVAVGVWMIVFPVGGWWVLRRG